MAKKEDKASEAISSKRLFSLAVIMAILVISTGASANTTYVDPNETYTTQ